MALCNYCTSGSLKLTNIKNMNCYICRFEEKIWIVIYADLKKKFSMALCNYWTSGSLKQQILRIWIVRYADLKKKIECL